MNYKKKKAPIAFLAVVLAVGVLIALFAAVPAKVNAADWKTAVADPDTLAHWSYTFGKEGSMELPASSENIGRIWVDKSVFTEDATMPLGDTPVPKTEGADFLVGLSALSSASSELKTTSTPLDIVLVLDVSGSMSQTLTNGQSKMDALKGAVNAFLDFTAEQNQNIADSESRHQVALIKFASDKIDRVGNDKTGRGYNYTQIVSNLTTDAAGLKSTVSAFTAAGATSADYGMQHAATVLGSAREKTKKVVIFFTDGEPNHSSGFSDVVANNAITEAKGLKDGGATIYTIGVFAGADPDAALTTGQNTRFNRYMHGVSSNYPGATGYTLPALGARAENSSYYKAAASSDELHIIFNEIAADLAEPTPPTQIDSGDAATTGGYITFTDTLGDYMEVKDLNGIFLDGVLYTHRETPQTAGNETTYVYTDSVTHAFYGEQSLRSLAIHVTEGADEKTGDTVTVRIPAALIPVRYYDIDNNETEGTMEMKIRDERPLRVFYSVGLKNSTEEKLLSGNITDTALRKYLNENTGADGKSYFYSNKYTSGGMGNTAAIFAPAHTNPFYFHIKDTPLYTDEACTTPATEITEGTVYYYKNTYYINQNGGTEQVSKAVAIIGTADSTGYETYADGSIYLPKGTVKVSRMAGFTENKKENTTETASAAISPTWDATDRQVHVLLGNNGRLATELPGNLAISKKVTAGEGLTAPDTDFEFTVTLTGKDDAALTGEYDYAVTDENGSPVMGPDGTTPITGKTTNGGKITLKGGQTVTVTGLPDGAKYTVTETVADGFTATSDSEEGSISSGVTADAPFTNNYSVSPVILTGADNIKVKKVLNDRQWDTTDSFTFTLSPASYQAPGAESADTRPETLVAMPVPEVLSLTVTDDTVRSFGDITFTRPGVYSYAVAEMLPDTGVLPGITYSRAVYGVIVTVTDNGDGTLAISSEMKQFFDDNRGDLSANPVDITDKTAVFTNTYSADAQPARIIAVKNYTDNSGAKPLTQNMFYFKLKALTPGAPMPDGLTPDEKGYVKVGNFLFIPEYGDVRATFPVIMFNSTDHDRQTYMYELSEDIPDGANADNGYTLNGMTYDPTVYKVQIEAKANVGDTGAFEVTVTYLDANENPITIPRPVFDNNYEPIPVTLSGDTAFHGIKTLNGRDMKDGETFDFTFALTGTFPAGQTDGIEIAGNGNKTSVSGGKDSTAQEFSFGDVTFKKPGQYTFTIAEDVPGENPKDGVTYDTHDCTVTVAVEDNNGVLEVTDVAYNNGAGATDNTQAVFVNTYASQPVTLNEDEYLQVEKVLEGREWKDTDRFFFDLVNKEQAPVPIIKRLNIVSMEKVTIDGVDHYRDSFDSITYTKAGVYTYEIYEDATNLEGVDNPLPGVTYDDRIATVVVTIADDKAGNLYVESVVYDNDTTAEAAVFTNRYKAEEITLTDSTALHGTKMLAGRDWKDSDSFAFTLASASDETTEAIAAGDITMPEATVYADKAAGGAFSFGDMTFTKAGTYNFNIKEVIGSEEDMTYDGHICTVTVEVKDNMVIGKLEAEVKYSDGAMAYFTNVVSNNTKTTSVGDGGQVGVGDELTYTINWVNNAVGENGAPAAATVTVTDTVPEGTSYVRDSADNGGTYNEESRTITWTIEAEAVATGSVSFCVTVLDNAGGTTIENEANIQVGDNDPKITNKVETYVPGKTSVVEEIDGNTDVQVGRTLVYTISYKNTENKNADITITDKVPEGLDYVEASDNAAYDEETRILTWTLKDVEPDVEGNVTFKAKINESAVTQIDNQATVKIGENGPEIRTNTDSIPVPAPGTLNISKTIEVEEGQGTEIDTEKEFTFKVTLNDAGGVSLTGEYGYIIGEEAGTLKSGGRITLKHGQTAAINGLPNGTKYTVTETAADGYTADESEKGGVISEEVSTAAFVNTYNATMKSGVDTSALFSKELVGRDWTENDAFSFTLTPGDETYPMPEDEDGNVNSTVTVGKPETGNAAVFGFGTIAFDAAGTYTYIISEVIPDAENALAGISYDNHSATLSIKVTDDGAGNLVAATPTVTDGTFRNNYAAEIDYAAAGGLRLTKTLKGRDMVAGQFKFQVTPGDQPSAEKLGLNEGVNAFTSPAGTDESSVDIDLLAGKTVIFTQDDAGKTYSYTVQEVNDGQPGYSYDADVRIVTIAVTDNGDATLTVTTTVTKGNEDSKIYTCTTGQTDAEAVVIPFENGYNASTDVEGGAKAAVSTTKTLTGRPIADGEFHFRITAQGHPEIVVVNNVTNDANGNVNFGELSYDTASLKAAAEAGYAVKGTDGNWTVFYTASEETGGLSAIGVTPTRSSFDFTVTVADNGNGTLTAIANMPEGAGFTNTYLTGAPILFNVNGSKVLSAAQGLTPPDITGKYKFTITGEEGAPMPEKTEVANDEFGNVDFGKISFSLDVFNTEAAGGEVTDENSEKTFTYTVTESGVIAGVTNDAAAAKTFTVTVTDNGQGTLTVTSVPGTTVLFTFTNTYGVTSTSSSITEQITIEKKLDGRNLAAEEFRFALVEGNSIVAYGKNDVNGKVTFDAVEYTEPGSHTYSVYEVKGEDGKGITYDSTQYTINTTVADKGDGTLEVTHTTEAGGGIVFENKYEAAPTSVTIGVSKVLTGKVLGKDEFTFQLKDEDGTVVAEAKNDEKGQVIFEALKYEETGTYKYTVTEVNDGQDNITYDRTEYKMTVIVTDDGNGHLTAEVSGDTPVFTNAYTKPADSQKPTDTKKPLSKTGDHARIRLFAAFMLLAVLVIAEVILIRRRRRYN